MHEVSRGGSKLLIDVGGLSLIERTVGVVAQEVDRVVVMVGHDGDRVASRAERAAPGRVEIVYASGWEGGNGATLAAAEPAAPAGSSLLVVVGDHLISRGAMRALVAAGGAAVLVDPNPAPDVLAEATRVLVDGERAVAFGKNRPSVWVDCGAFVLPTDIFRCQRAAAATGENGLAAAVTWLASSCYIKAVSVIPPAWWQDVDTPADLVLAHERVRRAGATSS